jgi:hypothetical protein
MLVYTNVYGVLVCWSFNDTLHLLRIFECVRVIRRPFLFRKEEYVLLEFLSAVVVFIV